MLDDMQVKVDVAELKTLLKEHIAHQKETNERLTQICEANDKKIRGNGHGPGLETRLDRLEQKQKTRNWYHGVIGASAVGMLVKELWGKWM